MNHSTVVKLTGAPDTHEDESTREFSYVMPSNIHIVRTKHAPIPPQLLANKKTS